MKWISMLGLGLAGIALLGCGPEETAPSCPDPASGEVDEACGIWVSASLGDDANPGTRAAPLASLTAAVDLAYEHSLDVYACGELWTEPLILRRNVSLFGGFDCVNGWAYGGDAHRARLETGPDQIPLKTDLYGGHMEIVDFDIRAADASVPGGSSIAVLIGDTNIITFRRCLIMARDAADGLDGEEIEAMATAGAAGNPGADACTTADGPGGPAAETTCAADAISRGGKGGDGGAMSATDGEAGLPAPDGEKDPNNLQDGDGGKGQAGVDACTPGEPGADGAKGTFALGRKKELGLLTQDGFVGVDGPDGEPGMPGQGGGGGGASRGGAAACGAAMPGGAGGGSGGAGGCGGKGGKGGQGGGSSFAVVAFDLTELDILSSELWVGKAGRGGRGAPGQLGGAGGEPGKGGAGQGTAQAGCQGGKGGAGGKGGGGAGGNGGHAVHIALSDVARWGDYTGTTFNGEKNGGLGGAGGDPVGSSYGADGQGNNGTSDSLLGFRQ